MNGRTLFARNTKILTVNVDTKKVCTDVNGVQVSSVLPDALLKSAVKAAVRNFSRYSNNVIYTKCGDV